MAAAFERAAAAASETFESWYRFGGRPVRLRIAGERLAERLPRAVSHLRSLAESTSAPALTIDLWDAEETGVARPIHYFRDAFDRSWPFGRAILASQRDGSAIGIQSHSAATIYDRPGRRMVGCAEAADRLSPFELGKPLQPLLFAWHSDHGAIPVHGGLVAQGGRGVLLGGMGGSGKTTTSLLCFRAGFDYLGDDYIGLAPPAGGRFTGYSFYTSTWLEPDHLRRFPWLEAHAHASGPDEDKQLVLLSDVAEGRLTEQATIVALALPQIIGGPDTTARRASATEAVLRLAPSSILQLPFIDARPALDRMTDLARAVPAYRLALGTELPQIPERIAEILAEAG